MKLYYLSQSVNTGYDTYDSAVVAAKNEEDARMTKIGWGEAWCSPDKVGVELIGTAIEGTKAGVIIASFNAG
jgi:hypothetical protein